MSNYKVLGRNVNIFMFSVDNYYRIACAKSISIASNYDEIETTTVDSPNEREYIMGLSNATVSLSAITTTTNVAASRLATLYLFQESVRRTKQLWRIVYTDQDGGIVNMEFGGFIRDVNIDGDILQWSQSKLLIRVSGGIDVTTTIIPPVTASTSWLSDWWATTNGNNFINGASGVHAYTLVSTDSIKQVNVEGTNYDIVSGTPTGRQCQLDLTNHKIIFPSDLVFDGSQTVFVEFER